MYYAKALHVKCNGTVSLQMLCRVISMLSPSTQIVMFKMEIVYRYSSRSTMFRHFGRTFRPDISARHFGRIFRTDKFGQTFWTDISARHFGRTFRPDISDGHFGLTFRFKWRRQAILSRCYDAGTVSAFSTASCHWLASTFFWRKKMNKSLVKVVFKSILE
jgi:hypothetical protein